MTMNETLHPMTPEHLYCTEAEATQQTIAESKLTSSISLGRGFAVHHGTRDGLPILIVECENQKPDELSCVWFDESVSGRTGDLVKWLAPAAVGKPDLSNYVIDTDGPCMTVHRLKAPK